MESDQEIINVEFEGRAPIDSDIDSIAAVLGNYFGFSSNVNLTDLAELVVGHNYVGSVLVQADSDEDSEAGGDCDMTDTIYSITSCLSMDSGGSASQKKISTMEAVRKSITQKCPAFLVDKLNEIFSARVGFLINQRFVNIPSQMAPPVFESLLQELNSAVSKKMPYDFEYLLLVCRACSASPTTSKKNAKSPQPIFFPRKEEEYFYNHAVFNFRYAVEEATDEEEETELKACRVVLVVPAKKLKDIVQAIKTHLS